MNYPSSFYNGALVYNNMINTYAMTLALSRRHDCVDRKPVSESSLWWMLGGILMFFVVILKLISFCADREIGRMRNIERSNRNDPCIRPDNTISSNTTSNSFVHAGTALGLLANNDDFKKIFDLIGGGTTEVAT